VVKIKSESVEGAKLAINSVRRPVASKIDKTKKVYYQSNGSQDANSMKFKSQERTSVNEP
jgi:hypothetical protein